MGSFNCSSDVSRAKFSFCRNPLRFGWHSKVNLANIFTKVNLSETLQYRSEDSCDLNSLVAKVVLESFPWNDFTEVGMSVSSVVILKSSLNTPVLRWWCPTAFETLSRSERPYHQNPCKYTDRHMRRECVLRIWCQCLYLRSSTVSTWPTNSQNWYFLEFYLPYIALGWEGISMFFDSALVQARNQHFIVRRPVFCFLKSLCGDWRRRKSSLPQSHTGI